MATNRSYETDGQDDPNDAWLQKHVRVKSHPEWGVARVMRWYPASEGQPQRVRIMATYEKSPKIVPIHDLEIVAE